MRKQSLQHRNAILRTVNFLNVGHYQTLQTDVFGFVTHFDHSVDRKIEIKNTGVVDSTTGRIVANHTVITITLLQHTALNT